MKKLVIIFVLVIASTYGSNGAQIGPLLLLANKADLRLIPALDPNNTEIIANRLTQAVACDYIYKDNLIFWMDAIMDYGKGKIQYVNMSDPTRTKVDVLRSGMAQPDGLACDWIGKKIYWTDKETSRIEVSEIDGSSRKILIWNNLDQPRAIAVDPQNGFMYWTDWGEFPKIERAGMDGSHRQVLIKDNIYWPNGITLDYEEGKVYWVEAHYHFIHRCNMDGTNREEVINSESIRLRLQPTYNPSMNFTTTSPATNVPPPSQGEDGDKEELLGALQHPFAITLLGERIYWTDWETDSIHSLLKNGSELPVVVKRDGITPMDLQVYSPLRQRPGPNPCGVNNGGCSHLCLLSPDPPRYKCACPTGVKIMQDNRTCQDGPNEILIFARRADLRVISLDTNDYTDVLVPVDGVKHAVAVEFDPVEEYVYWSDDGRQAILRAHLNGSGSETIISHSVEQSDGMAIDWIARNLYWTDTGRDYIAVSRLNGTSRKIIIGTGIEEPRAIVVDPIAGFMYWTDWGSKAKIERANLDGGDRLIFVDNDLVWPNGLALDHNNSVMYWADARDDRIEVICLNGTGRRIILSDGIPHVFGLSLLGNYLYWTDWHRRRIERMKVGDRRSREVLIDQLPDMMGVKATSKSVLPGTNPCAVNNGGCSHLCLYTPQGERCHCPTGLELAPSMRHCIVPEAFLLISFTNAGGIERISLDTARGDAHIPFENQVDASFLDFSISDNRIYWTNTKEMKILRSFMNGSNIENFMDIGIEMLEGLAVDWVGRNVYWADSSTNRIEVAHMDSLSRKSVVWEGIESPRCLAMDPENGYIYWSEWGNVPCIKRAEMDGSSVVELTRTGRANSLTIDYAKQRLYWVDFDLNTITSSDMNGSDVKDVVTGRGAKTISSLSLYGDYVYWSDSQHQSIERANKISGKNRHIIESGLGDIDDILVYHESRQNGVTACSRSNGGCQHLCLSLHNGKFTCSCPAHYTLNSDNVTCTAPANFLLMSQTRYITRIIFQLPGGGPGVIPRGSVDNRGTSRSRKNRARPSPDAVLPIRGMQDGCSLDYDPIGKRVYWLDCQSGEIRSSRQNGSDLKILLHSNATEHKPYDITVDAYSGLLYWTDTITNSIKLMRLDGTPVGTVLSGVVKMIGANGRRSVKMLPRKIVVDPMRGRLYFSNACDHINSCRVKIMQAALDGSDCIVFFNHGLKNVSALTVDGAMERLYWADQATIETSKLDGSDRTILVDTGLVEPVGLTIFGQDLYWVDAQSDGGLIEGADKADGSNRRKIQSRIKNLKDIVGVKEMDESALNKHPCSADNGGCSHICVATENGSTRCSCPSHLALVDNFNCGEQSTCGAMQFTCKRKQQCVPMVWRCDGSAECADLSDEQDCPTRTDCEGKFQCTSLVAATGETNLLSKLKEAISQCIDHTLVCDGKKDCDNGMDESSCLPCKQNEITCLNGECVQSSSMCNVCQGGSCSPGKEPDSDNTMVIVIGIVCGCAVLLGIGLFLRHCMTQDNTHYPPGVVMFTPTSNGHLNLNVNFQPHDGANPTRTTVAGGRKKPHSFNFSIVQPGSSHGSGSRGVTSRSGWSTYQTSQIDRPTVPGASSSSSTKRIPPSLYQTDTCNMDYFCSSDSPSVRTSSYYRCKNGHKHRRHGKSTEHGPPPPTPCTTDTCEDFDGRSCRHSNSGSLPHEPPPPYHRHSCCYHCYHQYNARPASSSASSSSHHCRGDCAEPPSYERHRHGRRRRHRYFTSGMNSDSDPYAPPPTPRSQYMSECCDTTEVEDAPEVEAITDRINASEKDDDEDTVLLAPSHRSSPSITEMSFSTLLYNPPPSPVTDSS